MESLEGITVTKEENFSEWYQQLILKSDLAEYSSVSGCIIFKPASYAIWELIRDEVDKRIKKLGVKNVYFPMLIPEVLLEKEKDHVEGFSPEVAWVTHAGNHELEEKLAIRPTSEAIMYDSYSKWIRSWRDLPLKYNQWNNVIRWEFNNPVPFFRTREFLWNEGHTVFETEKEALDEAKEIRKVYEEVIEEFLALPGIYGRKTEKEKFAGAVFSEKIHYYVPGGNIIEGPCFHHEGQNFAKAYDIKFLDKDEKEIYVWQNTWAISTRMLGTMFTIHSDNKGLVLPPKIALNKIAIVPIMFNKDKEKIIEASKKVEEMLKEYSPILDLREEVSPGWKYNEHELKGIPLRIEIGPRDLKNNSVIVAKRVDGEKIEVKMDDLKKEIPKLLEEMQKTLFDRAKKIMIENTTKTENKEELINMIKDKKMVIVPLCNSFNCEEDLKTETSGAKTLFIDPENTSVENKKCILCGKKADYWVYTGKTY